MEGSKEDCDLYFSCGPLGHLMPLFFLGEHTSQPQTSKRSANDHQDRSWPLFLVGEGEHTSQPQTSKRSATDHQDRSWPLFFLGDGEHTSQPQTSKRSATDHQDRSWPLFFLGEHNANPHPTKPTDHQDSGQCWS